MVERLVGQREAFVKAPAFPLDRITGISGAFITGDGSCLEVILSKAVLPGADGSVRGLVCTFQDISAQKRAEREVFRLSNYDDITGLPNRFNFLRLLADLLREASAGEEVPARLVDGDRHHAR